MSRILVHSSKARWTCRTRQITVANTASPTSPSRVLFLAVRIHQKLSNESLTLSKALFPADFCVHQADYSYSRHLDKHKRPFSCPNKDCKVKPFGDKAGLQRHRREVHHQDDDGKPTPKYRCPEPNCKRHRRGFARQWNMYEHRRRIHGIPTPRSHEPSVNLMQSPGDEDDSGDDSDISMSADSLSSPHEDRFQMGSVAQRLGSIAEASEPAPRLGQPSNSGAVSSAYPAGQIKSALEVLLDKQRALEKRKSDLIKEIDGQIHAVIQTIRLLEGKDQKGFSSESKTAG
ncbi:MAG: hypothetical protein MMC33_007714 [Icmadophila ericetorum]|nr:hypothetical protein [Icmadophila ericetorum]